MSKMMHDQPSAAVPASRDRRNFRIAGAGLDVYAQEPPAADNPLFTLPNITVTPHNASLTHETTDRMGLHAAQGIDEVLSGGAPTWPCVTPKKPR